MVVRACILEVGIFYPRVLMVQSCGASSRTRRGLLILAQQEGVKEPLHTGERILVVVSFEDWVVRS